MYKYTSFIHLIQLFGSSTKYCLILLLLSLINGLKAQTIELKLYSEQNNSVVSKLNYKKKFTNKKEALKEIENVISTLQYKGYLLASIDSIYSDSTKITAIISENEIYKIAYLKLGNLEPTLASKLGISEKLYFNKAFNYKEVARSLEKIIMYYENNGHPFVSVKLDSVTVSKQQFSAVLNVQKNKFFKIDSINVIGTAKVNQRFLNRYLSIKPGMPYNETSIKNISQRIKQLPFVSEKQPQRVQLTERTNKILLFIDKKNASQFDGIIGILPDATTQKAVITGDIKLKVVNGVFRNGETFDLEWRRLQTQTQDLNGRIIYPYLFGTPIGVDYALKIYRKDSTFVDIINNIGLQYYFSGLNNIKVFYKKRSSSLISTSGYENIQTLPEFADISTKSYGTGLFFEKLNYRFNPHKGFAIDVNGQTGNRTIEQNPNINDAAYEGVILKSIQYQFDGVFAAYIKLIGNHVLKLGLKGASVFGDAALYKNELFRIGGLKTLRGFDEESIYASTYVIPTLEYRFIFAKNSNILLFAEGAWYENTSNGTYLNDTPVSVGAGVNFDTKAGILSINYALGSQFGSGFDFRNGKIHFGLTALF